jgi:2,4-dienoyl-CoA reductase-like NADH-dependent reductase (Old Yellow Enzyme family)/thioredoxin reductase
VINKLFEPISVGPMPLRNRVVMTAINLQYTPGGEVTDRLIGFYAARARGGVGLIVVGGAEISDQAAGRDLMLSIKDDRYIPGLTRLSDALQREGAKTAIQLYMAGAYSFCGLKGLPILAPSEYFSHFSRRQTTAMTLDDIERVQGDFVQATRRAKEAGFDAVEVLASAGYLLCQFLSPKTNKRDDDYGGSQENRMRFPLETIRRVREEAGPGMAVIVRVAGNDFVPGSHTNAEARIFARAAEEAGADCISVTGGWHESRVPQITMDLPQAGYAYLAAGIKAAVRVPVVACNRINNPLVAERVLKNGVAELVGMARGLIADAEFVNKARGGKLGEIRRCVACNQGCFDRTLRQLPAGCTINPRAGRGEATSFGLSQEPKRILVAGAGPAGCEFALRAAQRGHKVVLCDKAKHIGGQVRWAAEATLKPEFQHLLNYYRVVLPKHGVNLRLGLKITPAQVAQEKPDMVVVATGAVPFSPPIESVEAWNVVQAWDVLKGNAETGVNVVVVGGGSVGLETAKFLAAKGTISPEQLYFLTLHQAESPEILRDLTLKGAKTVTVIEMAEKMGQDVGRSTRWVLLKELELRGVKLITEAKLKEIAADHIAYTDSNGNDVALEANTVVLAMGSRPENSLARKLEESGVNVRVIGDAKKCGRIADAIEDGLALACTV